MFPPATELNTAHSGRGLIPGLSAESLRVGVLKKSNILLDINLSLQTVGVSVFIVCGQEAIFHYLLGWFTGVSIKGTIHPKCQNYGNKSVNLPFKNSNTNLFNVSL